jgi:hypothetical protein
LKVYLGHWAKSCPENKDQSIDVKSGKCFRCGEAGHLAKFCSIATPPVSSRYHRERDSHGYSDNPRERSAYNCVERDRSPPRREYYRYQPNARDRYNQYSDYDNDYRKYPDDEYRSYTHRDRYDRDYHDYRRPDYQDYRR